MASTPLLVSSGSDADQRYAKFDERKRKRIESNRESARRSRMRKQQRLEELMSETIQLQNQNSICRDKIGSVERNYHAIDAENGIKPPPIEGSARRIDSFFNG